MADTAIPRYDCGPKSHVSWRLRPEGPTIGKRGLKEPLKPVAHITTSTGYSLPSLHIQPVSVSSTTELNTSLTFSFLNFCIFQYSQPLTPFSVADLRMRRTDSQVFRTRGKSPTPNVPRWNQLLLEVLILESLFHVPSDLSLSFDLQRCIAYINAYVLR